jgi:hypothetical protein
VREASSKFLAQPELSGLHKIIALYLFVCMEINYKVCLIHKQVWYFQYSVCSYSTFQSVLFLLIFLLITVAAVSMRDTSQFEIVDVGVLVCDTCGLVGRYQCIGRAYCLRLQP